MTQSLLHTRSSASVQPARRGNSFFTLPHYDFITFLSLAQRLPELRLFDTCPIFDSDTVHHGASGTVHAIHLGSEKGIVYKQFHVTPFFTEEQVYEAICNELLVLEHPVFKYHPNVQKLLGVSWDVQVHSDKLVRVLPVLVFEQADQGSLYHFLDHGSSAEVTLQQKLSICHDIAMSVGTMHTSSIELSKTETLSASDLILDIVHGDIKPENVLISSVRKGFTARVIDFGFSCFGSSEDDEVVMPHTPLWAAPEWHDDPFTIEKAKAMDVFSYGKLCAWVLFGPEHSTDLPNSSSFDFDRAWRQGSRAPSRGLPNARSLEMEVSPLLKQFFSISFQDNEDNRTTNIWQLLDLIHAVMQVWKTK